MFHESIKNSNGNSINCLKTTKKAVGILLQTFSPPTAQPLNLEPNDCNVFQSFL